jgi:hypothetical protein
MAALFKIERGNRFWDQDVGFGPSLSPDETLPRKIYAWLRHHGILGRIDSRYLIRVTPA